MVGDGISARVTGIPDFRAALRGLVPKLRKRVLRLALAAGGRVFRDEARRQVPVLVVPVRRAGQVVRGVGTVRKAISVRTSKLSTRRGDVGVFVNVRPLKAAQRSGKNPRDPFYWRWLEFGARHMRAIGFLQASARSRMAQALAAIVAKLGPELQKFNDKDYPG